MTVMWQMGRGSKEYRIQTEQWEIAENLKRRKSYKLVGYGFNCNIWIFQKNFSRPDIARKAFENITKSKIEFDDREDIFIPASKVSIVKCKAA
jgi:hypothetical protein